MLYEIWSLGSKPYEHLAHDKVSIILAVVLL